MRTISVTCAVWNALRLERDDSKQTSDTLVARRVDIVGSLREELKCWNDEVCFHLVKVDAKRCSA